MIPERAMWTAEVAEAAGGGTVSGYLTIMWGRLHIIDPADENTAYPIVPSTLQPVKVRPTVEYGLPDSYGFAFDFYFCPNCEESVECYDTFCEHCGQALDWAESEEEDG